jgi:hypothetical protein
MSCKQAPRLLPAHRAPVAIDSVPTRRAVDTGTDQDDDDLENIATARNCARILKNCAIWLNHSFQKSPRNLLANVEPITSALAADLGLLPLQCGRRNRPGAAKLVLHDLQKRI